MAGVLAKKSRTSSVSPVWLMSRWAGAGREQSQAAGPSWPVERFYTLDGMLSIQMGVGCWFKLFL